MQAACLTVNGVHMYKIGIGLAIMLLGLTQPAFALEIVSISSRAPLPVWVWACLGLVVALSVALLVSLWGLRNARHGRERLRTLWQHVPDVITEVDASGKILGLNRGFGELPPNKIIGTSSYDYLSPEHATLFRNHLRNAIQKSVAGEYELEVVLPDKTLWIQNRIVPISNVEGHALVISSDISAFKESERMLEKARQQAEEMAEAKSSFLAKMSHEIRTPLNGIVGVVNLLDESDTPQEREQLKDSLFRSVEHLRHIVDDILDFSKVHAGAMKIENLDTNLWQIVDDVEALYFQQSRDKGLHFSVFLGVGVPRFIRTDAFRLRQVLFNLMGNALKFTRKGFMRLNIGVQNIAGKDYLRFCVVDSGPGMDAETCTRIFEPFRQGDDSTSREYGGTGLGLAISRQLVECMGGLMGVESRPGVGSEFWFTLPLLPVKNSYGDGSGDLIASVELQLQQEDLRTWFEYFFSALNVPESAKAELLVTDHAAVAGRSVWWLGDKHKVNPQEQDVLVIALPLRREALYKRLMERQKYNNEVQDMLETQAEEIPARQGNYGRILLVEDNPTNQLVVKKMLEKMGYAVEVADNGEAGVHAWERDNFQAIIMDIQMPVMDGIEATRQIRQKEKQHIPIIALTANAQSEIEESCFAVGMDAFLTKPVNRVQLQETLRGMLGTQPVVP